MSEGEEIKTATQEEGQEHEAQWSNEWPKEPGYYFYYGNRYDSIEEHEKWHFVSIQENTNGELVAVGDGAFWYQGQEGTTGSWTKVTLPEPPERESQS